MIKTFNLAIVTIVLSLSVCAADSFALPRAEFVKYYEQITGKKPSEGLVSFAIDPKISKTGMDAYAIRSNENGVSLSGSNLRSLLYAVYDLLERRGGCRWFWDGDVVPRKVDIDFSGLDVREESQFEYRGLRYFAHRGLTRFQAEHWGFEDWKREIDWCAKKRLNFMMLRIGMDDAFQRAFPDVVDYPDPSKPIPEAMEGYDNRSLFWSLQYRSELRKKVMDYAFERGMMQPEDFGTMTHWYSRTPKQFLEKMNPPFLPQKAGYYGEPNGRVWDIREEKWLNAYWRLTEAMLKTYGRPDLLHTIGLGERMCFTNRSENLAMKIDTLKRLCNLANKHYPDSKIMLAGWDFYCTWRPAEVQSVLSCLDPSKVIILDYEADSTNGGSALTGGDVKANDFTRWGVVGKFPYTFGIFLAYESGLDIRANYAVIRERQKFIENDPMCKGYIFWPEVSHTDTLLIEYFTRNSWCAKDTDIDKLIDVFCKDRYGKAAESMAAIWKKVVPVSCLRNWGGTYGGLLAQNDIVDPTCWSMPKTEAELSKWECAVNGLDDVFRDLANIDWEGDFIRRDTVDLARTALDRMITYKIFSMIRDVALWREGKRESSDFVHRANELARLSDKMADVLSLDTDYSLWESYCRLDEVEKIKNPEFTKVLFDNASCKYCRSHQYELAKHWYAVRAKEFAKRVEDMVASGDRKVDLSLQESEVQRKKLMEIPLNTLAPTLPRTPENYRKIMTQLASNPLQECAKIFESEIKDGVIHGAAVIAGGLEGETISGSWGWADSSHKVPMTTRTVIDMASVTKTAAGITAFLAAHAKGMVDFDTPFTNSLPAYSVALSRKITIRDLANHISGFGEADGNPRVYFTTNATQMLQNILSMPPKEPIKNKVFYSCRNYILLGQLFETITGRGIAEFCQNEIFDVIGMSDTSLGAPRVGIEQNRLAQTMGTKSVGQISDWVASPLFAANIGTFNAGMFSSAEDMAKLLRVYLRGGVADNGVRIFGENEMREIAPSKTNRIQGARSFGWQYYDENLPEFLLDSSLFHSGWSGQTVLFDLKRKRYAIVITTRSGDYARAKRERLLVIENLMK